MYVKLNSGLIQNKNYYVAPQSAKKDVGDNICMEHN